MGNAESATIEDGLGAFHLEREPEGIHLLSVVAGPGGAVLLRGDGRVPLWRSRGTIDGGPFEFSGADGPSSLRPLRKSGVRISWRREDPTGLRTDATVTMKLVGSGLVNLELELEFGDPVRLREVEFPVLGSLSGEAGTFYAPYGYGKALALRPDASYQGRYPSHHCTMQFLAWNSGASSLYLGCHDPLASTKELFLGVEPVAQMGVRLPVSGSEDQRTRFAMPYPTLMGVIPGDWYDVASFYRSWALKQRWCSAGPVAKRSTPRRLREISLWCQCAGAPEAVVPKILEFRECFGVPLAVHWYVWHEIPFDDSYPEYFPPKAGFTEAVRKLSATGILVMPYINARLWDPKTESWMTEGAEKAAAKDPELKKYVEVYASKVPLSPMCPTTQVWRRKVGEIVSRLASEHGVDGVYLDQIAAAAPKLCYDSSHGHELGGGAWWVDGYRELLDHVRRLALEANPNFFLTTESNAEPWSDQLDALLMCNSTEGDLVPLFPAVYSDRILTFGAYIFRGDLEDSWAFRTKVSQMFLWGSQLGWLGFDILEREFAREAEYLRSLAQVRAAANGYLAEGRLLRPPSPDPEVQECRTTWELWGRKWEVRMPVAASTFWKAGDGSVGLICCNMGDRTETLHTSLPLRDADWSRSRASRLSAEIPGAHSDGSRMNFAVELGPRSARCVRIG